MAENELNTENVGVDTGNVGVASGYKQLPISDGVNYLKDGYIDYAKEVISERAIVNLYDGLKPVNRRILWTFNQEKRKGYIKSATISGNTLAYHPHSDAAVYKASITMTDNNGFSQFPLIDGSGSFGDVSSGARAAASRYTEMKLHTNAREMFHEMNGIDMIPNFDATLQEPSVLPASFPYVLVNPSEGIAVGFSSKIPSFNFNDVINLTLEYLETGKCSTVIAPDFMTGGYYVWSNKELKKLMQVGKASLKLRGKYVVQGKEILFTEVPFGKTVASLKTEIDNAEIEGVSSVSNLCDFDHGIGLSIECKSKQKVDSVLYYLMKDTGVQYSYNANITVVKDGVPRQMGVWTVIEEWVKWRREVMLRATKLQLEDSKQRIYAGSAFMKLIENEEKKLELVHIVASQGRKAGYEYIRKNFTREEIPEDLVEFVGSRNLNDYHTGGKYATEVASLTSQIKGLEADIENIDKAIIRDLKRVMSLYGGETKMPRRTEITNKDYEFIKEEEAEVLDTSTVYFGLVNNFLKKLSYRDDFGEYDMQFKGTASDVLVGFDNRGRLLRVYTKDIPLCGPTETGVYLPRYFGFDEGDDYQVMWLTVLDGSTKMLLYKDGYVGFLDTSEFLDTNRQIKVLQNGIGHNTEQLGVVFDEIPEVLMVTDTDSRLSWVKTDDIKRKGRTARTKVFNVHKDSPLYSYCSTNMVDLSVDLAKQSYYEAPYVRYLESADDYRGTCGVFYLM